MIWAGNSRTLSLGDGREVPAMLRVGVPVGFTVAHQGCSDPNTQGQPPVEGRMVWDSHLHSSTCTP